MWTSEKRFSCFYIEAIFPSRPVCLGEHGLWSGHLPPDPVPSSRPFFFVDSSIGPDHRLTTYVGYATSNRETSVLSCLGKNRRSTIFYTNIVSTITLSPRSSVPENGPSDSLGSESISRSSDATRSSSFDSIVKVGRERVVKVRGRTLAKVRRARQERYVYRRSVSKAGRSGRLLLEDSF